MSSFEKSLGEVNGQLKMVIDLLNKYSDKSDVNNSEIVKITGRLTTLEKDCKELKKKVEEHIKIAIRGEKQELEDTIDELLESKKEFKKGIVSTVLGILSGVWQVASAVIIAYLLLKGGLN